jgi:hypothetical protein
MSNTVSSRWTRKGRFMGFRGGFLGFVADGGGLEPSDMVESPSSLGARASCPQTALRAGSIRWLCRMTRLADELGPDRWQDPERVACNGNVRPHPLPYGRGSDGAQRLTAMQKRNTTAVMGIGDMASDCFLAASKGILVGLGAAGGQDARAPGRGAAHEVLSYVQSKTELIILRTFDGV